jgi:hypothetical protein
MIFMGEITFGSNFFIGGKSAELNPFSTVSQVTSLFIYPDPLNAYRPLPCSWPTIAAQCQRGVHHGLPTLEELAVKEGEYQ